MTCATCDDLHRQLREAREEIEAWEAGAKAAEAAGATAERLSRWRKAFAGARGGSIVALMLMADRPGRPVTPQQILDATRGIPGAKWSEEPGRKVAAVMICYARKSLRRAGCAATIENSWGLGWVLSPASARAIKTWAGEAA